jgi:hypothetical protein
VVSEWGETVWGAPFIGSGAVHASAAWAASMARRGDVFLHRDVVWEVQCAWAILMDMDRRRGVVWFESTVLGQITVARAFDTSRLRSRGLGLKRPCRLGAARVVEGGGERT